MIEGERVHVPKGNLEMLAELENPENYNLCVAIFDGKSWFDQSNGDAVEDEDFTVVSFAEIRA